MTTNSDTTTVAAPARWRAPGAVALLLTVTSLIATSLTLSPPEADAYGGTWFKPPWPCVVVRANVPGMPRYGFCPSHPGAGFQAQTSTGHPLTQAL
jgi:hypothetical protein